MRAADAQAAGTGIIAGRVRLAGPSPGNPIIRMGVDPKCGSLNSGTRRLQEIVLRGPNGGLANAFVDLEGAFPASPLPKDVVTLDQRNCIYAPRVVGARVGQTLQVRNGDPLIHNVHGLSAGGNAFNFSQPSAGMVRNVELKTRDVMLRVKCDIHSWMVAYVGVEPHPYFAVSGADGAFTIAGVPPGRRTVRVWHERYGQLTQTVTVTAGKKSDVEINYTGTEKPTGARLQDLTIPGDLAIQTLLTASR